MDSKIKDEWDSTFYESLVIGAFVCLFVYNAYQIYTFQKHKLSRISVKNAQIGFGAFVVGLLFFFILEEAGFTSLNRHGRVLHAVSSGIVNLSSGIAMYHFWKCVPFSKSKDDDLGFNASRFV